MKRTASIILLALTLWLALGNRAGAAPCQVIYRGGEESFTFTPLSADLFERFKKLMPGSLVTQVVTLTNQTDDRAQLLLRREPIGKREKAFLAHASLAATLGGKKLFDYAGTGDKLTEPVLLKVMEANETIVIELELTISKSLGNEYQSKCLEFPWTFIAREGVLPEPPGRPVPATGQSPLYQLGGAVFATLALIVFFYATRKGLTGRSC